MPSWVAILIGASITLLGGIVAWLTFGLKLLERREEAATWRGQVDADRKSFKRFMKEMREVGRTIMGILLDSVVSRGSPLQLTPLGETISKNLDAPEWAKREAGRTDPEVLTRGEYAIQEYCFDRVGRSSTFSDRREKLIAAVAFRHGVSTYHIRRVLAIELRDRLLEKAGLQPSA